jgi:anti-sigma B factor antagonist
MIAPFPGSEFSVAVQTEGSVEIVVVRGEVDIANADAVRADLNGACERSDNVVLDLREVTFMDTQGLSVVIEAQQSCTADGTQFAITRAPDHVHRLFDMIGLTPRLTVLDDPAAAAS